MAPAMIPLVQFLHYCVSPDGLRSTILAIIDKSVAALEVLRPILAHAPGADARFPSICPMALG